MTSPDTRSLLTAMRRVLADRSWGDPTNGSRELADAIQRHWAQHGTAPSVDEIAAYVPTRLTAPNGLDAHEMASSLAPAIADVQAPSDLENFVPREPLIPIDAIDSFAAVRDVSPEQVSAVASPLALPERTVKAFIASIIGEPYVPKDWGGEGNDLFTDRIVLDGRRTSTAFLLKGSGTAGRLTIKRLGANGDQLIRMAASSADLLVVQHVGPIDDAVRTNLVDLVRARRADRPRLVGSVWDGVDCARLLLAFGLIDLDGSVSARGQGVLEHDRERLARNG